MNDYIFEQQLKQTNKINGIKNACRTMTMNENRSWKLGAQEQEDSETGEVVLRIQGIVCNRDLPPIKKPFRMYVS